MKIPDRSDAQALQPELVKMRWRHAERSRLQAPKPESGIRRFVSERGPFFCAGLGEAGVFSKMEWSFRRIGPQQYVGR
jgi:hypothetical protein